MSKQVGAQVDQDTYQYLVWLGHGTVADGLRQAVRESKAKRLNQSQRAQEIPMWRRIGVPPVVSREKENPCRNP